MPTYLLPCPCGDSVRVEPRQAGERVACACGDQLEAPPLRKMRELPPAPDAADDRRGGGWSYRQGVLTAGLILASLFAAIGGYFWRSEPAPPSEFDGDVRTAAVARDLDRWTPKFAFEIWRNQYEPILRRGRLDPFVNPAEKAVNQQITMHRIYRWTFLGVAVVVAIGSVATALTARDPG